MRSLVVLGTLCLCGVHSAFVSNRGGVSPARDWALRAAEPPSSKGPPLTARSPNRQHIEQRDYADAVPPPDAALLRVIGHVRSPYRERFGTPRQPPVTENTLGGGAQDGTIELLDGLDGRDLAAALDGLDGFDYCWCARASAAEAATVTRARACVPRRGRRQGVMMDREWRPTSPSPSVSTRPRRRSRNSH